MTIVLGRNEAFKVRTAAELQAERIRREAKELVSKGDVSAKEARQEADRRIQEVEVRGRGCQEGLLPRHLGLETYKSPINLVI